MQPSETGKMAHATFISCSIRKCWCPRNPTSAACCTHSSNSLDSTRVPGSGPRVSLDLLRPVWCCMRRVTWNRTAYFPGKIDRMQCMVHEAWRRYIRRGEFRDPSLRSMTSWITKISATADLLPRYISVCQKEAQTDDRRLPNENLRQCVGWSMWALDHHQEFSCQDWSLALLWVTRRTWIEVVSRVEYKCNWVSQISLVLPFIGSQWRTPSFPCWRSPSTHWSRFPFHLVIPR